MGKTRRTRHFNAGPSGWLSIENAALYASVSPRTIQVWLKEGLKCSRKNRKTILIRPEDIDEFLFRDYSDRHKDIDDLNVKAIVSKITSLKANQH